ncbi:aminopeptidase P family protein [Marinobacter halodurans]|uniref:Aminopeptidase P family protein n=1 Tax=Marinobacter halodurans TaxID=2528979 RepID=A0ABY1ZIC8_9GAMM|nr:Xaa-Pro peptidase family protein [Marinobacter halodurans]TBW54374.1 aminopeptidase P family protein [Marinobacter halodurans]
MDFRAYEMRLRDVLQRRESAFTDGEYQRRCQALDRRLDERGLDALLVTNPAEIYYLTGYNTFEVSVHAALVYSPSQSVLQVPSIETGTAVACARVDHILGYRWEAPGEVVEPLADCLAAQGRRIGVDRWGAGLRSGLLAGLEQQLPDREWVDASGLLDPIRRVKSGEELECLEQAARLTEAGVEAARRTVAVGRTDSQVAAAAAEAMYGHGSEFMSMQPIVVAGPRSSVIHTNHRRFPIQAGEPVFIELGAAFQRYTSPIMHTIVAGSGAPDPRMQAMFEACRRVYDTLVAAMKPGATFDSAAQAAESAWQDESEEAFFSGVYGYTIGGQFPPSWVEGSGFIARGQPTEFEENMVFHLPLCFRIPGLWGMGFSETVRVTRQCAVPVTRNRWQLESGG